MIPKSMKKATHNAGKILSIRFLKYCFKSLFLSNEEYIKKPLITKNTGTPGKYFIPSKKDLVGTVRPR